MDHETQPYSPGIGLLASGAQRTALRAAIIGAGPIGIAAALYAVRAGYTTRVYEREPEIASSVRAWGHLTLWTPWGQNRFDLGNAILSSRGTILPSGGLYHTGHEYIDEYLEPLSRTLPPETLQFDTRAVGVTYNRVVGAPYQDPADGRIRRKFRVLSRRGLNGEERLWTADLVLDCTGGSYSPAWMGVGGLPAVGEMGSSFRIYRVCPDVLGKERIRFSNKVTLLVGADPIAAETVVALADLAEQTAASDTAGSSTELIWAMQQAEGLPFHFVSNDPLARRDLVFHKANLHIKKRHEHVQILRGASVEEVRYIIDSQKFSVAVQVDRQTKRLHVDNVISACGYLKYRTYLDHVEPSDPSYISIESGRPTEFKQGSEFKLQRGFEKLEQVFSKIHAVPDDEVGDRAAAARLSN